MRRNVSGIRVIDLTPEHEPLYFVCLEDWPGADVAEAGDHKARWYARMRDRGLRVKLALDAEGRPGGMIQYVPIDESPALGRGLEFVLCVWVHVSVRWTAPGVTVDPSREMMLAEGGGSSC